MSENVKTRYSLIQRARDLNDQEAWAELNANYSKFIYYILHQLNVPPSDIDDLSQDILVKLTSSLDNYNRKKGDFRVWLRQLIKNTAFNHFRKIKRDSRKHDAFGQEVITYEQYNEEEIDKIIMDEWKKFITQKALARAESTFKGKAMEILKLDLQEKSIDEICAIVQIEKDSVYTLRARVKKALMKEIRNITNDLELD